MNPALRIAIPLAALLAPTALLAQEVTDEARAAALAAHNGSETLATVDGVDISLADAAMMFNTLPPEAANMPSDRLMEGLMEQLVSETALYRAALEAKMDEDPEMQRRLAAIQRSALAEAYLTSQISEQVTDAALEKAYNEAIADFEGEDQIRARHILVKTEDEAKALIKDLAGGAKFEQLAAEKSTGPSGPSGGDLGYFNKGQMVPAFAEVAFALKKAGDISAPVETQFGWHVIKLEDRRKSEPPAFGAVKDQMRAEESRKAAQSIIDGVRENADISMSEDLPPAFLVRESSMFQQ